MRKQFLYALLAMVLVLAFVGAAWADEGAKEDTEEAAKKEEAKHEYVGVKKCKICHKKDGIFESWSTTKHATAFDDLSAEDQAKEELKPFYTTGTTAKGVVLTGVQCEACHGPGADFKKKSIMQNLEKAVAAGLIIPDEKTCARCHNEKAPGVLGTSAKDFDFAKKKEKGVHAPRKAEVK